MRGRGSSYIRRIRLARKYTTLIIIDHVPATGDGNYFLKSSEFDIIKQTGGDMDRFPDEHKWMAGRQVFERPESSGSTMAKETLFVHPRNTTN